MVGLERLAVIGVSDDHVVVEHDLEREVGRVAAVGVGHHELAFRIDAGAAEQLADGDADPGRVELRPARDAVDVGRDLPLREGLQLVPGQGQRVVDLAEDVEIPLGQVERGIRPDREHRKALGQVLPRWHASGIDAELLRLPLPALAQDARRNGHDAKG